MSHTGFALNLSVATAVLLSMLHADLIDVLIRTLLDARSAVDAGAGDAAREALTEGYLLLGDLYVALDSPRHPEVAAQLASVFDGCMVCIGRAKRTRDLAPIDQALSMLRPLRNALAAA
jgi:flagellin-specific chaperone FliS